MWLHSEAHTVSAALSLLGWSPRPSLLPYHGFVAQDYWERGREKGKEEGVKGGRKGRGEGGRRGGGGEEFTQ